MRASSKIMLAVGIAIASARPAAAAAHDTDPLLAVINTMKHSVTPVLCVRPHAANERFKPIIDGTGFFISKQGAFLTAAHVVRDFRAGQQLAGCPMAVWFAALGSTYGSIDVEFFTVTLDNCIVDDQADIGRCQTDADMSVALRKNFQLVPAEIDPTQRQDGLAIAVTGYPLFNFLPITSRGYVGAYQFDASGPTQLVLDRAAWPGGSGSPVYDARGKVLGIVTMAGEGAASGISYARSSFAIGRFLAAHPFQQGKK